MVEFVKKQQEALKQKAFELTKEKDELFQKIINTKTLVSTKAELIKSEFKIKNEELEKEFIEKKSSTEFSFKKNKLIEKEFKTKVEEIEKELSKRIALIENEFKNKIDSLEKKLNEITQKITNIHHDIRIMDREIKEFKIQQENKEKELEKKLDELKIKELDIKNNKINKKIIILEKEKNKEYKNILFKIISLGFYNRKKIIINQIDKLNLEIQKNDLLKINLESKYKIVFATDTDGTIHKQICNKNSSFENIVKIDIDNEKMDLENQPSTSGYKQNLPKM